MLRVKAYLQGYRGLRYRSDHSLAMVEQLSAIAEKSTSIIGDGIHSGSKLKDDAWADLADAKERYKNDLAIQTVGLEEIEAFIEQLPCDDLKKTLLRLRYIEHRTWPEIAEKVHYSLRRVQGLHGQALLEAEEVYNREHPIIE